MKPFRHPGKTEAGVVLLFSLIMLVALTLGSLALFRQVGTGVMIASNLAFKSSALVASDLGIETARGWLTTTGTNLESASLVNGYFAAWCNSIINGSNEPDANNDGQTDDCKANPSPGEFDPLTYNWTNSKLVTSDDGNGNEVRYVIHRLCRIPGALNYTNALGVPQECVTLGSSIAGMDKNAVSYGSTSLSNTIQPYYRITTRTVGPRNTIVYSQMTMY